MLAVQGDDSARFLQTLISNDMNAVQGGGILYTALLAPQGKYLFDAFVVPLPLPTKNGFLLDIAEHCADAVLRHLMRYRLRRAISIEHSDWCGCYAVAGDAIPEPIANGGIVARDPRHSALGWRCYADNDVWAKTETNARVALAIPLGEWTRTRVRWGIPETGIELIAEQTYILEAGFARLRGVSFDKGCYVGQEVTARMRHKTTLRKGLVQVVVSGKAAVGAELRVDERSAGMLYSQADGQGLAHVRFDRARAANGHMRTENGIKVFWPNWDNSAVNT